MFFQNRQNITVYGYVFYLNPCISLLLIFQMNLVLAWVFNVPPLPSFSLWALRRLRINLPRRKRGRREDQTGLSSAHCPAISAQSIVTDSGGGRGGEKERRESSFNSISRKIRNAIRKKRNAAFKQEKVFDWLIIL